MEGGVLSPVGTIFPFPQPQHRPLPRLETIASAGKETQDAHLPVPWRALGKHGPSLLS